MTIEQEKREMKMFGGTIEDMIKMKPPFLSNSFYAICILSDAQEMIERDEKEVARQFINKAKYFCDQEDRDKPVRILCHNGMSDIKPQKEDDHG